MLDLPMTIHRDVVLRFGLPYPVGVMRRTIHVIMAGADEQAFAISPQGEGIAGLDAMGLCAHLTRFEKHLHILPGVPQRGVQAGQTRAAEQP